MQLKINKQDIYLQEISKTIFCFRIPDFRKLNKNIVDKFHKYKDHANTRKSHFFEGRHENIYIPSELISEIQTILSYCIFCVEKITQKTSLHSGLWFNYMKPGHITIPHSHDEADELYSAVYYVNTPDNSGHLIITENNQNLTIKPTQGMLVLFPPNLLHHVTKNNSKEPRLSLGINIGN